ncbi:MAG: ATP-binding protein [Opitutaceae bacterium]
MPRSAPLRVSFQAKVLAPVLAFLVLLPTVTLWIINRHISEQALAEARQTLTTADAVFRNSLDLIARGLATRFRGVVNEPRFKAVAQLGDVPTMSAFLRESLEEFGAEIEFVTYSLEPGTMLAGARREAHLDYESFQRATLGLARDAFEGDASTGTVFAGGRMYSVVAVPVPASDRLSVAGVLTIGLHFGDHSLRELRSLTRTEIVAFAEDRVAAATITLDAPEQLARETPAMSARKDHRVMPLQLKGEHFLALSNAYMAAPGRPGFNYLLLSSYEVRLQALRDTQLMLGAVSLIGIIISASCVSWLIRRVTKPLRILRDSAEAVGRGDFTQRVKKVSRDECGEVAGAFNQMTDNLLASRTELEKTVHTLRSTDARLRESEEQLRLTIESARDHMICTLNAQGGVQRWNGAAERMLGYTAAEAQGLAYASFFLPEEREAGVPERLLATAASHGREAYEGWRVRRNGTRFWAEVTLSRLPEGAGFVEIARDATLRKDAEETLRAARDAAETANRAKTDFIANMSHELRTPMNSIIGMSSLLLNDQLSSETRDSVQTIRTSADALLEIIDDILDVSKIEAGRLDLESQPYDLCGCIEQVVDGCARSTDGRDIEFVVHLARDLPAVVVGDALRLRQVLGKIISNAIKFTEQGGVTLSVSRATGADGTEELLFSVQDTGIGIPANQLDRLFKMFSQVDASTTRRFGGTGLGLAISKRLVELMHGTIGVESDVGRGSRFYFTIKVPSDSRGAPAEFSGLDQRRVLVVGSPRLTTQGVGQQFVTWGASVTCAATAVGAPGNYDLVVLTGDPAPALNPEWEIPVVQLVPFGESAKSKPSSRCVTITTPVKPRALYAAARKLLELARRPAAPAATAQVYSADFSQRHPLRILLVEDNPVNAHVAQKMLQRFGYSADWAVNGCKALERLAVQPYDLVLMDLQMPEMGGLEATRMLRTLLAPSQLPYVMALTANARQDDREACAEAGMHDFISKPVQLEKLAAGLSRGHEWVSRRAAVIA